MKPLNEMSDKEFDNHLKTIIPHLPIWKKDGARVVESIESDFIDRNGNKARVMSILWKDKKGKDHNSIAWVKWE
jgi:hypothetical protein